MQNYLTFDFQDHPIRIIRLGDDPWWVATDIAKILGYRSASDMVRNLDDDEADTHNVRTSSQNRQHIIISESGLYNAIFKSRRQEAKAFRRWITDEVLPTLRRTGRYIMPGAAPEEPNTAFINAAISAVREARRLFGPGIARAIWRDIGLPLPDIAMDSLPDGLEQAVSMWALDQDRFTNDEVAQGIGLGECDQQLALRLGEILRRHGWAQKRMRRGKRTVNGWYRAE